MVKSPSIRVLRDDPLDGPMNMARDETLLTRVGEADSPPTLRLYQWRQPTISLGYFQRYADYEALPPPENKCDVVRRLTGGGAILHDLEVTYSLTLPIDHALLRGGPNDLYVLMHEAVIACAAAALRVNAELAGTSDDSGPTRGPFFCFARRHRYDVLVAGDKLAGSAQRRTRQAVLQHGSIILASRYPAQPTAPSTDSFAASAACFCAELPREFSERSNHPVDQGEWTSAELTLAEQLAQKYAGNEWTKQR